MTPEAIHKPLTLPPPSSLRRPPPPLLAPIHALTRSRRTTRSPHHNPLHPLRLHARRTPQTTLPALRTNGTQIAVAGHGRRGHGGRRSHSNLLLLLVLGGDGGLHCGAKHGVGAPGFGDAETVAGELVVDADVAEEVGQVHGAAAGLGVHEGEALAGEGGPEEAVVRVGEVRCVEVGGCGGVVEGTDGTGDGAGAGACDAAGCRWCRGGEVRVGRVRGVGVVCGYGGGERIVCRLDAGGRIDGRVWV